MTQIVHRHTFTIADAVSALLPDIGDCAAWQMRVDGDELVIDVVEPASDPVEKINTPAPQPGRKGGALARSAGIICGEKGFWTFAEVRSADEAAQFIRRECEVESRADIDHDEAAATKFKEIERRYRLWLEGYD